MLQSMPTLERQEQQNVITKLTMSSILLRKLTRKSTLNFGKFKDYTVEHLFGMKKQIELTSIYFKLSTITFTDDILNELVIDEEYRIEKTSKMWNYIKIL